MGIVQPGIPKKECEFLKKNLNLNIFIEGGTYYGDTAKYASEIFEKVFTIEKSKTIYEKIKNLSFKDNVKLLGGDTRDYLDKITFENDNILYWLDSHWSGGETYGEDDECPLLEELKIIFNYKKNFVILIDDARLFLAPPPLPHKIENWPIIREITNVTPKDYEILIYDDVIYIINKDYKFLLWSYFQGRHSRKNRLRSFFTDF